MASFVVMEPPADRGGEQARFIRDSFAFFAFLAPPVWFAWHRLWVEAAVALALVMGIGALGDVAGFGGAAAAVTFLVMLFAGFEARGLRIAGMERRGWRSAGVVEAASWCDAELRWFHGTASTAQAGNMPPPLPPRPASRRAAASPEGLGLIDYPGAR